MSSIIEGYNYDIFISYRQKDNKHDGWVTEFVNNLEGELESTFKEEISVYFDINPHDGLLENHDVDESLKDKLKCLVFIPIISRTYCDPKSFAWEHEFKAFVEEASKDKYGLKVKLPNGNVASRVLPIRIYDLESQDIKLCESALGSVLRGVEFVYKSAGVNRPLTPSDNPDKNLYKTYYRDQINKVANGIKEIISGLKGESLEFEGESKEVISTIAKPPEDTRQEIKSTDNAKKHITISRKRLAGILGGSIGIIASVLAVLYFSNIIGSGKQIKESEKSIAVLPFKSLSDDPNNQYLADGIMDAILLHLSKIKNLRVLPRTSVEQYRGTTKFAHDIGQELDVEYLLEGSFQKFGDHARLIVQLIKARKESHIWANEYNNKWNEIFSIQSEVAQTIAKELYASITPAEKGLIEKVPTGNLASYDLYLKANNYKNDYRKTRNIGSYQNAVTFYKAALAIDSAFAKAYTGLAYAYYNRYYYSNYFKEVFLDSCLVLADQALSIDDQLDEAYYLKGVYYYENGQFQEALDNYDKALKINPNYYLAYSEKGHILTNILNDYVKGIDNYNKALNLIRGDDRPAFLRALSIAYLRIGFIEKAKYYVEEAFKLDKDSLKYYSRLEFVEFGKGNFEEAYKLFKKCLEIDSTYLTSMAFQPLGHEEEMYLYAKKYVDRFKKRGAILLQQSHRIGYAFYQVGKKKEAEFYFDQQIKYDEEIIKLGRELAQWNAYYDLAATYVFLDDKVKAYQYLDEYNKMGSFSLSMINYLKNDPLLNRIRNEERFQKILQNMEAKYQAEHERVKKWLEEQGML